MTQYDAWKLGLDVSDTPDCQECGDVGCPACEDYPPITCTHNEKIGKAGMCSCCREEYDEDPEGWLGYGDHKEGIERWQTVIEQMKPPLIDGPSHHVEIPF